MKKPLLVSGITLGIVFILGAALFYWHRNNVADESIATDKSTTTETNVPDTKETDDTQKPDDSVEETPDPKSQSFETAFLSLSAPAKLIAYDGRERAKEITTSGAVTGNAKRTDSYNLENQRGGYYVVASGIISNDTALIDLGLKAYEWGFSKQVSDGSFPLERADEEKEAKYAHIHPLSFFLESAARTVMLIRASDSDPVYKARAEALVPKLALAVQHMNNPANLDNFFANAADTNMLTTPAAAFQEIALLTNDEKLTSRAKWMVEKILTRQLPDGTFPEKKKFDTSYQTVSLEYLTRYAGLETDAAWKAKVLNAIQKGVEKFLSKVDDNGKIDTSDNSRTVACGERVPGTNPKGKDIDIIPIRLYYAGFLLGKTEMYGPVADTIQEYGQGFDHSEQCIGDSDI